MFGTILLLDSQSGRKKNIKSKNNINNLSKIYGND